MNADFKTLLQSWASYPQGELIEKINSHLDEHGVAWEFGPHPEGDGRMIFALSLSNGTERVNRLQKRLGLLPTDCQICVVGIPPRNWEQFFDV